MSKPVGGFVAGVVAGVVVSVFWTAGGAGIAILALPISLVLGGIGALIGLAWQRFS